MSVLPVLLPIIKSEEPNPFSGSIQCTAPMRTFGKNTALCPPRSAALADKQFALLGANPRHPPLQFKKLTERAGQELWSARVTLKIPRPCRETR
jgi:hypothetical protein